MRVKWLQLTKLTNRKTGSSLRRQTIGLRPVKVIKTNYQFLTQKLEI